MKSGGGMAGICMALAKFLEREKWSLGFEVDEFGE